MEQELQIIIAGTANVGKSTMMLRLEKWLKENGYNVELSFDDHPDYSGENSFFFHQKEEVDFDLKEEAIKSKTKIVLKEAQLKSTGYNDGGFVRSYI
jgi:GTPase SAR1 family protein